MDPLDFFATARELLDLPSQREANYRSCISRAYYGVFISIQNQLKSRISKQLQKKAQLSSRFTHNWVITKLMNSGVKEIETIGKHMENLKIAREKADYDMRELFDRNRAIRELENAEELR